MLGEDGGAASRTNATRIWSTSCVGTAGVTPPRGGGGFGRSALRFQGKIFAMLVRGRLVVKLPARRVDALVEAGDGVHFDANKGTPMREWLSLDPDSGQDWLALAREALDFARSRLAPAAGRVASTSGSVRPAVIPRSLSGLATSSISVMRPPATTVVTAVIGFRPR